MLIVKIYAFNTTCMSSKRTICVISLVDKQKLFFPRKRHLTFS